MLISDIQSHTLFYFRQFNSIEEPHDNICQIQPLWNPKLTAEMSQIDWINWPQIEYTRSTQDEIISQVGLTKTITYNLSISCIYWCITNYPKT